MAAVTSLSFAARGQSTERKVNFSSSRSFGSDFCTFRPRLNIACDSIGVRASSSAPSLVVRCASSSSELPTISETQSNFLKAYKRPILSAYSDMLQEVMRLQHLIRYTKSYSYDSVFGLGFVTFYDQLMEEYPGDEDREAIFQAYINALNEDPQQYRADAKKLEEWARAQTSSTLVDFSSRDGEVEGILKDIAERNGDESFICSWFFSIGLFRLLELSNATEPTVLEKLCAALNIPKRDVDGDLKHFRSQVSWMVESKELLKEYVARGMK